MSDPTEAQDGDTASIGRQTSGQQGATPTRETQQETGGNGGDGLTRNQAGPAVNAPDGAEALDQASTHANAGAQDTRAHQAGRKPTGLGAAETGANQDECVLPPVTP